VEEHLEKEVAEFFGESGVIGGLQGVEDFVGFFDEISAKSGVSLFPVPGAATGRAKARHECNEPFESGPNAARTSGFRFARAAGGALRNFALGFARGHENLSVISYQFSVPEKNPKEWKNVVDEMLWPRKRRGSTLRLSRAVVNVIACVL
jgi:hypothetical protein